MRKPDRICLLDELRGLAVLLMIFYHGAYDAVYIFRFTGSGWFTSAPMDFLQRYIAVSFILIAGIMGRYSRSNFRRGVKTFLCGLLLPWIFLFLAGYWLGEAFLQRRAPEFCYREHLPALGWIGRHALIIYLAHQPVVYGVLRLADWLL